VGQLKISINCGRFDRVPCLKIMYLKGVMFAGDVNKPTLFITLYDDFYVTSGEMA
jgi:hypothetical protein